MRATKRRLLAAAALVSTALWAGGLAQGHLSARASVLDRLESSLLDLRILAFGPRQAPPGVMIAAIDDDTIALAGSFPLPRHLIGAAVTKLLESGANAVAIDALFLDPGPRAEDTALADALACKPAAVAAMIDFPPDGEGGPGPTCRLPIAAIRRVVATGTVNIALDRSGTARHVPLLLSCRSGLLPALPLRAASLALGVDPAFGMDAVALGPVNTPLDAGQNLALRYYGPEGSIATVSLAAVLRGDVPPGLARGRTVLIGATAHGAGDRSPTPFDAVLPGVEILATAVANLETGDALMRTMPIRRIDAGVAVVLALAVVGCLMVRTIGLGLLAAAVLLAAWIAAVLVGFSHGVWFAMALPLAAVAPTAVAAGAARLALDRWTEAQLRRQHAALAGFHAPAMLARLMADPSFLAQPVEREAAVLFIDLSGFTGLSERLGPALTRDLLQQWHEIVEETVSGGGGLVASYMADGAMLVWGLTESGPADALLAVRTAVILQARTLAWLAAVEPQTGPLGVKLGGHFGTVSVSRLGHARHRHITAIGDTVNVASRLMKVAADRQATMALSAGLLDTARRQGLPEAEACFTPRQAVAIRGREQPVLMGLWTGPPSTPAAPP